MSTLEKFEFSHKIVTLYSHESSMKVEYVRKDSNLKYYRTVRYDSSLVASDKVSTSEYIIALIEASAPHEAWVNESIVPDTELSDLVGNVPVESDTDQIVVAETKIRDMVELATPDINPEFSYEVDGLTVVFTNETPETADTVVGIWEFSDGDRMDVLGDTLHEFPSTGSYDVKFTVGNSTGFTKSITKTIVLA